MTVQIKLDTHALSALFPEGAEARVELQSAVIAEFLRKNIKPQVVHDNLRDMIDSRVKEATRDALKQLGVSMTWARPELTQQFKAQIQKEVHDQVNALMREGIRDYVASAEFLDWRDSMVKMIVEQSFRRALDEAVNQRLQQIKESLAGK